MTPTKKGSPKKTVRSTPTRRSSRNRVFGNQDKDAAEEVVMDSGKENNAEEDVGKKKKASRKYTGKRKEKKRPNFGFSSSGSGPTGSGSQPKSNAARPSVVDPIVEEVDSEEDKEYVYESETFVSPISSDEDGCNVHKWTQHNTGYGYGEVYFELG
ncbi:hypothetical protein PIB30_114565, partial [Stylosanthes scabra]|nr:hypothetical protein [Stylosanthes scabra]